MASLDFQGHLKKIRYNLLFGITFSVCADSSVIKANYRLSLLPDRIKSLINAVNIEISHISFDTS